ncbi:MAG: leucine-rich repeat domain-containing protein, partial [Ruminococcus sp.]|nr:leucine-rich repeat domain-containing protein [Ruminococcus sp.]
YFSDANGATEITQQDTVVPYFKYTITDSGEVRLDKYNGTDAVVTIPATIPENYYIEAYRGQTIVTIHAYSFQNNTSITDVTIGNNIETIGFQAFYNCSNLKTATIGTGLKSIYYESFSNCPSLTSLTCYSMHKLDPYGAPLHEGSDNAVVYAFHDSDFINIAYPAIGIDAHTYIATFNWVGYACNTATIECEECDLDEVTVDATVTSEVTTPATYTQAGVRTYTATAVFNGTTYTETKTEAIDPVELVKGYSLLLKDEIGMRYYLDVTDDLASGASVEFTWGTGDYQKSAAGDLIPTDKNGANYYVDCFVAARCMTDTIYAEFTLGDGTVITDEYSIAEFCADAANLESYGADEKNCLCAMLEYGAAAQAYFNYPSNGLASSYVTSVLSDYQPVSAPDSFVDDTTTIDTADLTSYGIEYYGATLVLGSRTAVRLYFTKAYGAELPDPIVNGREVPWYYNNDNGRYYLQITGISAKDIFNDITVQFGDSAQLIYNVKNYYNSGKVSDIMKKLYVYSYYADRALNP